MYKLEGRLETTCTHVKGNVETQCTNQRKFGNTMDKFRKKSRKNNVQLEGKFGN